MDSLLEALGRGPLVDDLLQRLGEGQSCWLSGPSGTGKTELAKYLAGIWSQTKGDVHWIVGDRDQAGTAFLGANRALATTRPRRAAREADREIPIAVLRGLPWVGGPMSALAKVLVSRIDTSGPDFLSVEVQDLLGGFQKASLAEHILFVVDNAHWLDPGTADLLVRMRSKEVALSYSFIDRSVFLFVETTDQKPIASIEPRLLALKAETPAPTMLRFPLRNQFPDVLRRFGLNQLPEADVCDHLYDVTRGHLKLAKEIVHLLEKDGAEEVLAGDQTATATEIAERLLQLRLEGLPTGASQIQKLLGIASCIGQTFSRRELECAFSNPEAFAEALKLAQQEEFLAGDGEGFQFAHEVVQSALRAIVESQSADFHAKLAECVRHIRPGDYRSRLRHSAQTGNHDRTASIAFGLLMQERRGETLLEAGVDRPDKLILGNYLPHFEATTAALQAMDKGRHAEAIQILVPFYDGDENLVQGEIAYLISLNYYKKRSRIDYQNARAILEPWIARRDEGELWHRLMLTLAVVHASLGDQRGSSEILTRVRTYLERSARYDSSARAKIHVLNRKADVFYPIEVAGALIQKAVEYFAPPVGSNTPRNAFQYVAALINAAGNLYVRGEFASGQETASTAVRFITAFSDRMRLPEAYKAFNNYAICAVRAKHSNISEVTEIFDVLASATGGSDRLDFSLLAVNRGAADFIGGRLTQADLLFKRAYDGCKMDGVEGYYLYFSATNYAASQYLLGSPKRALELIDEGDECLGEVPDELRRCLSLRQRAMRQAITSGVAADPLAWDRYPKSLYGSDGPHISWRTLGNGVVMSDIQVWSES